MIGGVKIDTLKGKKENFGGVKFDTLKRVKIGAGACI
jgi:hypothetical protein